MKKNFWKKLKTPILALAPMAGWTDSAFRQMAKKYGADVVYSEMASVSALYFHPVKSRQSRDAKGVFNRVKPEKTLELLKFKKTESPYVVQLFGRNPEHFAKAVQIVSEKIKPDGIDINFGCPVKKIFKEGSGCALMLDKKLSREIIQTVLENTKLPVSIKIRAGIKNVDALEFVDYIKDLSFAALMIHGRTFEQGFSGPINCELINKIRKIIPEKVLLVNGGINSPADAIKILKECPGIDGLGIAHGALGKPFIFKQIKDLVKKGNYKEYDFEMIKKIMLEHSKLYFKNNKKILELRKHLSWYARNFPGASEMRRKLVQAESLNDIKNILK